jgi:hypothetical protein
MLDQLSVIGPVKHISSINRLSTNYREVSHMGRRNTENPKDVMFNLPIVRCEDRT